MSDFEMAGIMIPVHSVLYMSDFDMAGSMTHVLTVYYICQTLTWRVL